MSATAKQKHTNSFICILPIITSFRIIVSFFISSNFIRNEIRTKSKIKFSNSTISISLVTYKITFILNIILKSLIQSSLIIKLSPLDTPSKLGRCLSPSASSFSICLLNLNKPLYISTKLKFILSLF